MKLWELHPAKNEVRMPAFCDKSNVETFTGIGCSPTKFRKLLDQQGTPLCFRIIDGVGRISKRGVTRLDITSLSWMPLFSERAFQFCISFGLSDADFVPCEIDLSPRCSFFMHVPRLSYDILDVTRSKFGHVVPLQPPLPFHLECAVLKKPLVELPQCFRVPLPGRANQVMKELFVNDEFKQSWEDKGLYGGEFREVRIEAPSNGGYTTTTLET
jgi:hypothetical protein